MENGGENKIIDKIQNEDAEYLILSDDYVLNWQNPMKVRDYIKQNMRYTGNIGVFYTYENRPKVDKDESAENKGQSIEENTEVVNE